MENYVGEKFKSKNATYTIAYEGNIEGLELLLKQGGSIDDAIRGLAAGEHWSSVKDFFERNASTSFAAKGVAEAGNEILAKISFLKGANIHFIMQGAALNGDKEFVFNLLNAFPMQSSASNNASVKMLIKNTLYLDAICGAAEGDQRELLLELKDAFLKDERIAETEDCRLSQFTTEATFGAAKSLNDDLLNWLDSQIPIPVELSNSNLILSLIQKAYSGDLKEIAQELPLFNKQPLLLKTLGLLLIRGGHFSFAYLFQRHLDHTQGTFSPLKSFSQLITSAASEDHEKAVSQWLLADGYDIETFTKAIAGAVSGKHLSLTIHLFAKLKEIGNTINSFETKIAEILKLATQIAVDQFDSQMLNYLIKEGAQQEIISQTINKEKFLKEYPLQLFHYISLINDSNLRNIVLGKLYNECSAEDIIIYPLLS